MKKFMLSLLVIVSAVFSCCLFTGCGQSDEDAVSEISLTFVNNLFAGNVAEVKEIATAESVEAAEQVANLVAMNPNNKSATVSIIDGTVNEDKAIVKILVERPMEKDVIVTVPLQKIDGEWKVTWTKLNGGMENC